MAEPKEIGLREARAVLGDLAHAAAADGQITYLTSHGRRVAAVVAVNDVNRSEIQRLREMEWAAVELLEALPVSALPPKAREAMQAVADLHRTHNLTSRGGVTLRDCYVADDQGRKWPIPDTPKED
jgi:antitoxin (DNA-binding transcriptional repressor) of toxin-antitoxin stability system